MKALVAIALCAASATASLTALADEPAPATPAAAPSPAPGPGPAPPAASSPRAAGRGVVVVALGEGSADAARALARSVYADAALRAPIDEKTAQILCGAAAAPDDVRGRDLAALRASLDPDPTSAATRRALESLAAELGARGVVAVARPANATAPRARIIQVGAAADAGVELAGDDAGGTGAPAWPGAAHALRSLFPAAPAPTSAAPSAPRPAAPLAPNKAGAKPAPKSGPIATPADAATAAEDAFYERPWFWVALGAFAAAGVTALVVSQTGADEPSDSVRFRATIPQASFTLP